jgi:hypothetical protein
MKSVPMAVCGEETQSGHRMAPRGGNGGKGPLPEKGRMRLTGAVVKGGTPGGWGARSVRIFWQGTRLLSLRHPFSHPWRMVVLRVSERPAGGCLITLGKLF